MLHIEVSRCKKIVEFSKIQLKWKFARHLTRPKQRAALRKLFNNSPNLAASQEPKFSYENIQKHADICFQSAS